MVYCDRPTTKNLIEKLPTDAKITIKEMYTELQFDTTRYELLVANESLNKLFSKQGNVKVLDVLLCFGVETDMINNAPCTRGILYGWTWGCYLGYDQPWIDFWLNLIEEDGRIIFALSYDLDPCEQSNYCTGEECNYAHETFA